MTTIIKGRTKRGQAMIEKGEHYCGFYLSDVYTSYSVEKQAAWDYCFRKYCETDYSSEFHICSYNTFGFSVAWCGEYIYEDETEYCLFIETKDNSYVILLNR